MSNPGMMLTANGRSILAKGLTGKVIHFTKVSYGAGDFDYETESVSNLTELRDHRLDVPIVGKIIEGNGIVNIKAQLNNFDLLEGFAAKEVGVFALDPDSGEEMLYAYRNAGDEYTFIPANTGPVHKNTTMGYRVEIQDAPNVTFNINFAFAYVSQAEYEDHVNSAEPHPNTPTHLDDVETTDNFWVTDLDSHLHKLPTDSAKNLLLHDADKKIADNKNSIDVLNHLTDTQAKLGVDPSIFVFEDFNEPLIDNSTIQVFSCARGGNLLAVVDDNDLVVGEIYYLSDGINCELVTIENVVRNVNGIHAQTTQALQNSYDLNSTFLLRTTAKISTLATFADAEVKELNFVSRETFLGSPANSSISAALPTDYAVTNGGFVTSDGFFTM